MLALAASADGVLTPEAARTAERPVLVFQGGIHAGEIDGKDAGFLALRKLLGSRAVPGALASVTWLFVPVFNVDGHERFGRWHRPNQRGPEEMGWRTTAQRLAFFARRHPTWDDQLNHYPGLRVDDPEALKLPDAGR